MIKESGVRSVNQIKIMAKKPKTESLFADPEQPKVEVGEPIKPAATTEQVITSTPPKEIMEENTINELEQIEQQKAKILEKMKSELERYLSRSASLVKTLERYGVKEVLTDPRFHQSITELGVNPPMEEVSIASSSSSAGGGSRGKKAEAILDYATKKGKAVTVAELVEQKIASGIAIRQNLAKLIADGKMKEHGRNGRTILYAVK